ncbi:MAG: hypothetical protein ACT4PS_07195 [Betaproteobacteria bacterium]
MVTSIGAKLDTDGDGFVGRIEAAADADAKSKFERLDQNADEKLSRQEYEAWGSVARGKPGQSAMPQESGDGK